MNDTTALSANHLPGMVNLHSHAFQRAMAGLAERRGAGDDSFWTWRETMYAFASRLTPDDLLAIAAQLYVEMLKAGYTHVCEFHYLHHQPDGTPYANPAAMSEAIIAAAGEAGIGLTLLPVLYMTGGFDARPLADRQRRFGHTVDAFLHLLQHLRARQEARWRLGMAFHSLRAVQPDAIAAVLADDDVRNAPIHIHVAEQTAEVDACLAARGTRPVQWLLDNAPVDAHWCLVHATHMTADETTATARSGAVAGLCPTTEASLGDGLFPLPDYMAAGGQFGIGSDSHISVSPVEELRWLEYGQRLALRKRAVAARRPGDSVGTTLWQAALQGGRQAAGLTDDNPATHMRLDTDSPLLAARTGAQLTDSFMFAGNTPLVRDVHVAGRDVVRDFHHADEERIAARFRRTMQALADTL
ncbi:MAG TPA: formimidoylglutamate deiminase [Rhodanobacteraceae bacterium]